MLHELLYALHIIGMASIISISLYFMAKKDLAAEVKKKLSLYLMSAAHTQLLTGFALFFLMLSEVNHMKIGIKMLIAIEIAVVATILRKKDRFGCHSESCTDHCHTFICNYDHGDRICAMI